jgi:hypothetical protein
VRRGRVGRLLPLFALHSFPVRGERVKASVRAKVERPLRVLKLEFGYIEHRAGSHPVRAFQAVDGAAAVNRGCGMSASASAAWAMRRAQSASQGIESCTERIDHGVADGPAESVHLKRHCTSRCADLP